MFVYVQESQLVECLKNISKIEAIESGAVKILQGKSLENAIRNLETLFASARLMPAFGVSLHHETTNALQEGKWIKLSFSHQQNVNGLLFDALVFQLTETSVINLIREFEGKYEGRCLYVEFDKTINLQDLIT